MKTLKRYIRLSAALILFGSLGTTAHSKEYSETVDPNGRASTILQKWGEAEKVTVLWQADYDFTTAHAKGKQDFPSVIIANSAKEAVIHFIEGVNRDLEAMKYRPIDGPEILPLRLCIYEANHTYIIRRIGQNPCDMKDPS